MSGSWVLSGLSCYYEMVKAVRSLGEEQVQGLLRQPWAYRKELWMGQIMWIIQLLRRIHSVYEEFYQLID